MMPDVFDEDEPVPGEEPEPWRSPARCPHCRTTQTRFIRMEHEASIYECDLCGVQFEAEE